MGKVSGLVTIEGSPAQRLVRAFSYDTIIHQVDGAEMIAARTLGQAMSDGTGAYEIDLAGGFNDPVFVVAFDDYGEPFVSGSAIAIGDRIHPSAPNGNVYDCTADGLLPEGEPTWSLDTENPQPYGTTTLLAVPFYRALVHGPLTPISLLNSGYIVLASAVSNGELPQFDVTNEGHPDYAENFIQSKDFGLFRYVIGGGTAVYIPPTIKEFDYDDNWRCEIYAINASYSNDYQDMLLEFLDAGGAVVYTIHTFRDGQYSANMEMGPPGSIAYFSRVGYGRPTGRFFVRNGVIRFYPSTDTNNVRALTRTNYPAEGIIKKLRATVEARTTVSSGGASNATFKIYENRKEVLATLPGDTPAVIDSGYIMGAWAHSGSFVADSIYEKTEIDQENWNANWRQTHKIQAFEFSQSYEGSAAESAVRAEIAQTVIPVFDNQWIWDIKAQRSAYSSDQCVFRIEFLDANGSLIYLITCENSSAYQVRVKHGPDDISLSTVGGTGQAQLLDGILTFRSDGFDCVNQRTSSYVYNFSANFDATIVTQMRFSGYAYSTQTPSGWQGSRIKVIGRSA